MPQGRRELNLDSRVLFADLIRARDSMKYEVASEALKKMGAAKKCAKWVTFQSE